MIYPRWKALSIIGVCLLGLLLSVPNLLPRDVLPSWARQISLGLDLRGGSYLLLEVDTSAMVRERLETLVDSVRRGAAQANPRILYTGLSANPAERRVSLKASDPARASDLARIRARRPSASARGPDRSSPTSR